MQSSFSSNYTMNDIMCVDVASLFLHRVHLWGYLRSSGSRGLPIFEDLCRLGKVPLSTYVKLPSTTSSFLTTADHDLSSPDSPILDDGNVDNDDTVAAVPLVAAGTSGGLKVWVSISALESTGIGHPSVTIPSKEAPLMRHLYLHHYCSINQTRHVIEKQYAPISVEFDNTTHTNDNNCGGVENKENTLQLKDVEWAESITLPDLEHIIRIDSFFLNDCFKLIHLDLSTCKQLQIIGPGFCRCCVDLRYVTLPKNTNLVHIPFQFMLNCKSLQTINLSIFTKATTIPDEFLSGCHSLTHIDLKPLVAIKTVGDSCLMNCKMLLELDLTPLHRITTIASYFLSGCEKLSRINLAPLSNVTSIKSAFLQECKSLTTVDLSPLSQVTYINESFLRGCEGLTAVDFTPMVAVKTVGDYLLSNCSNIVSIDLSGFGKVTTIGLYAFENCSSLQHVDLSPLAQSLTSIKSIMFGHCTSLTKIDLTPITRAILRGGVEFRGCTSLTHVKVHKAAASTVRFYQCHSGSIFNNKKPKLEIT